MTEESIDWDRDIESSPEEEYQAFIRSLQWTDGFGLFFVRCSPASGDRLIAKVKKDVAQQNMEVLDLDKPVENLYDLVSELASRKQIDILFISGIEHSLYEYEEGYEKNSVERYSYSWKGVPRILGHLNLQRERFRDNFDFCLIFLLPLFGIKYFIRRSPDFFDWRSGIYEFVEEEDDFVREDTSNYWDLTTQERHAKLMEFKALLEECDLSLEVKANLLYRKGSLLYCNDRNEEALQCFSEVLDIDPNNEEYRLNFARTMYSLDRLEEAVENCNQVLEKNHKKVLAWNLKGLALSGLERYEQAIESYECALDIDNQISYVWSNLGWSLQNMERYEEALSSYDEALKINSELFSSLVGKASSLRDLGFYQDAIEVSNKALAKRSKNYYILKIKGVSLMKLGKYEEAIKIYNQLLEIYPDNYFLWYWHGNTIKNNTKL